MTRGGAVLLVLWTASVFGACNLVLGIDDVSSANGPDSGQRISSVAAESHDGGAAAGDSGASGRADAAAPESDASPGPERLDAGSPRDRDAAAADASADEDAGAVPVDGDDAGVPVPR